MAASNNANLFMSKVSRYVGNIAGTNAYWNRVREELKAIITNVGAPTIFFSFSSADMHWPRMTRSLMMITNIRERRLREVYQ